MAKTDFLNGINMHGNAIENCPSFVTGLSIDGNKIYWKINEENQLLLAVSDKYLSVTSKEDIFTLAVDVDGQGGLGNTGQGLGITDLSAAINKLDTGESVPVGTDYYIAQWADGGTQNTTYVRRPVSKLAEYIRSTFTIPTVGNGTITITQTGQKRGSFTLNQSENATIELTDTIYTLPKATVSALGGIKIGYTPSGQNYPVQLNGDGAAYVNVPWVNTWRPLGTTADTACAGNDSRLSDARTAKDVYAWAKKSSLSEAINTLSTGESTPTDADYYVTQYAGGGTTITSYLRRPHSSLWNYIKAKTNTLYLPLTGGTMQGPIKFNANSLPEQTNVEFLTTIDGFANGGTLKWKAISAIGLSKFNNDLKVPTTTSLGIKSDWDEIVILLFKDQDMSYTHYVIGTY